MAHYPKAIEQQLPEPFDVHSAATPVVWGLGLIVTGEEIVRRVDNSLADLGGCALGVGGVGILITTAAYASIVAHRRKNIAQHLTRH